MTAAGRTAPEARHALGTSMYEVVHSFDLLGALQNPTFNISGEAWHSFHDLAMRSAKPIHMKLSSICAMISTGKKR
jgi:hypothetical protein